IPAIAAPREDVHELRGENRYDVPITVALGLGWIGSEALKSSLAPKTCRWCDEIPSIDRAARERLRWSHPDKADSLSNAADFVALPVVVLGFDALAASEHGTLGKSSEDALYVIEAVVAASALNQSVKFAVARERPFVHALSPDQKPLTDQPSDNDLSFYSGHTTLAFALVA